MTVERGRPLTLDRALERAAAAPEAGLVLLDRREQAVRLPWSAVRERALHVCAGLRALGVERGEPVALLYPTTARFFDAFFGAVLAGGVPAALPPPNRFGRQAGYRRLTAAMVHALGARLVLSEPGVLRRLGGPPRGEGLELGWRTLDELPAGDGLPRPARPGDPGLVQFSSGTTVAPKPVALSHRALLTQAALLNGMWPDEPGLEHVGASWLPLHHDMGLVGCVLTALERPGRVTLLPPEVFAARPAAWLRAISRFRATVSAAPNFGYLHCLEEVADEELDGVDLSCWRIALNGAEPVSPAVMRRFAERFARWGLRPEALTPVYGLAEASLAVTFSDLDRPFVSARVDPRALHEEGRAVENSSGTELASVGRPLPGFAVEIRGANGRLRPEGGVGRIWTRGPSLMDGYLNRPEATRRVLRGGWLDTGDLGFLRGGELFLTGRAKDLIILRGRNYSPEDIERPLRSLPGVCSSGVAAIGHLPASGEREELLLFVEAARGSRGMAPETVARACREAVLTGNGLAADGVLVLRPETLPRTTSGKIRRQELLRRYLAGELELLREVSYRPGAGAGRAEPPESGAEAAP